MRLSRNKRPETWQSIEELVDPCERDLYDHTLAGLLWERQLEKVLFTNGLVDSTNFRMLFRASSAKSIPVRVRGRHCKDWDEEQPDTHVGKIDENTFSGSSVLGMH